MSRFSLPPDPVFVTMNASIGFDWRLYPYDVEAAIALLDELYVSAPERGFTREAPGLVTPRPPAGRPLRRST